MTLKEEWDDDYETCERWSDLRNPFMAEVLEFSYQGRYPVPGHSLEVRVPTTNGLEESDDGRMCWTVRCDAGSLQMHTSIRAARRLARFILDQTEDKKQVPAEEES